MRMDSDVQDVFARHQLSGGETKNAEKKIPKEHFGKNGFRPSRRPRGVTDDVLAEASTGSHSSARAAPVAHSNENPSEASYGKELMLRRILQLTEEFLNHPGSLLCARDEAFKTTMELVRALGQQHQQDLAASGHLPALLRLEAAILSTPNAHPRPMHPTSLLASLQAQGMTRLSEQAMLSQQVTAADPLQAFRLQQSGLAQSHQHLLQQQQQHQPPAVDGLAGVVDQFLLQNLHRQRYQQQAQQQEQQFVMAGGAEPKGVAAGQGPPARSGVEENTPGSDQHEEPQFTTARELLMRVMNQRK